MSGVRLSRGHPLVALLAVLGGWVGGRAATWEAPGAAAFQAPAGVIAAQDHAGYASDPQGGPQSLPQSLPFSAPAYPEAYRPIYGAPYAIPSLRYILAGPAAGAAPGYLSAREATGPSYPTFTARHLGDDFALGDSLPRFYAPEPAGMAAAAVPRAEPAPAKPRRWSADAWALLRRDGTGAPASPGALPATYGASQAGAVLRYRLSLASRYRPTAYMRTTSTLGLMQETSAALGLSARPLPGLPVIAAVEARLTDQGGKRRFQPAAMAVTQLPWFALPAGFRGEAYAQAGYVAGRYATPFADGQFRADRPLVTLGKIETRLGAGVWGGAQKGAGRLDAGPSASIAMPLARGTSGRVALDWRFRLVGKAVPDSGPAVTLSAGF